MRTAFASATLERRRTESSRLLGLVPLAAVPAGLYVLGRTEGGISLPAWCYVCVELVVAVLGLLRGAQAVRSSEQRAERDPLTGLANRRGLARAFDAAQEDGPGSVRIVLLDVDDFKQVNDTWGHDAGDALLCEVGSRLRAAVGDAGVVARSGGDEFVVLLRGDQRAPYRVVSEVFDQPFDVVGHARRVRVSAGVAQVTAGSSLAHVLADADIALYAAKGDGKGMTTAYTADLRERVLGRLALVNELTRVLDGEKDAGSLVVHYQPLVDLNSGSVFGCEALVRWEHPTRGLLAPDRFLGLAEEHGLAARLDRWVLDAALAQLLQWDRAGLPELRMNVNLGRSSMEHPRLAQRVIAALSTSGIDPSRLHVEITEHHELPPEAGVAALKLLSEHGVGVGLDDFGVGYTSLDYLRRYPIGVLKLDRSITRPLEAEQSSPLLEGIVGLARSLGVSVLAEGIETPAQRDRLAALGIAYGQGFSIARPMPPSALERFLRAGTPVQEPALG
nr:EAL domain-containing protein [Motilibacter aurantiacus]